MRHPSGVGTVVLLSDCVDECDTGVGVRDHEAKGGCDVCVDGILFFHFSQGFGKRFGFLVGLFCIKIYLGK